MGSKKAAAQLQIPVNTDEEWEELLQLEGLVVVDVYSGWSGPCIAMVGALRKFKMEEGGDLFHLAIARNDEITALERFRGTCEPTWMFIGTGNLIKVTFGADAPRLIRLMRSELEKETEAINGEITRTCVSFDQLTEEEAARAKVAAEIKRVEDDKKEEELKRKQAEEHAKKVSNMTTGLHDITMIIYLPFLYDSEEKNFPIHNDIKDRLSEIGLFDKTTIQVDIDEDLLNLVFNGNVPEFSEETQGLFETDKATIIMVATPPLEAGEEEEEPKDILETVVNAIFYVPPAEEDQPPEKSLAEKYITDEGLIGVWTPKSLDEKFSAFETYFPDFANTFEEPPPPPIPPHVAVAFDAVRYPELHDTIVENSSMIMDMGFFTTIDPATAVNVAKSVKQYARMAKTGTEKMIFKINTTKDEALLNFGQFKPLYVSYTTEIGDRDCATLFPPREKVVLLEGQEPPPPPWLDNDVEEKEEGAEEGEEEEGGEQTTEGEVTGEGAPEGEPSPQGEGEGAPAAEGEGAPAPGGEGAPAPGGEGAPAPGGEGAPAPGGEGAPAPGGEGAPAPGGEGAPAAEGAGAPAPGAEGAPAAEGKGAPAPGGEGAPAPGGEGAPAPGGEGAPATGGEGAPAAEGGGTPAPEAKASPSSGTPASEPAAEAPPAAQEAPA